jgi:hypothetical protein
MGRYHTLPTSSTAPGPEKHTIDCIANQFREPWSLLGKRLVASATCKNLFLPGPKTVY